MAHLISGSPRSGRRSERGQRRLGAVAFVLMMVTTSGCAATGAERDETCPGLSVADLRSVATKADRIVQGSVLGRTDLQDETTSGSGIDVRVDENIFGTAKASRVAVWQPLDVPDIDRGEYVFFLVAHPGTTTGGGAAEGYDTPASGAILAVEGEVLRRVCRSGRGPGIERSALDAVVG